MLYNIEKNKIKKNTDCLKCPYFDKATKSCQGLNKVCFEIDTKTNTVVDGITKMPIKLEISNDNKRI